MCQAGAWFCFDEFNRIDIEVLSVVAQQIREIQDALQGALKRFIFQGSEIPLNSNCAVFITMNPGYAGRTELPDNLKALFRPVAMMIPDYALIAEIMLYSEGFKKAKPLSQKMVQLYKLSSEQLSQQRHYDFGMRAVKSVLVMAGQLRRDNESLSEDIVLIRAMRESNLPKFLADDVPLFEDIVSDLFPGAVVPQNDYGELMTMMMDVCKQKSLQLLPHLLHKTIELYDTFGVRHGVMLVGPTQGGKTACRDILSASLTRLREEVKSPNQHFQTVVEKQLNPKAISIDEMFGFFNELTQEWKEGLLSFFVSEVVKDDSPMKKWIIFDGPVDTLWIESLNTVLDDSKTLCLPNRKRIKLTSTVSLLFEVENLDVASPATVSRCGMVYIDPATFPWIALVQSWVEKFPPKVWNQERKDVLINIFQMFMDKLLDAIHPLKEYIHQPFLTKVKNVMQIMESYFIPEFGFSPVFDESGNMRNIGEEDDDDDSASKGGQDERAKRAALFASLARESMVKPLRDITEFEGALRHLFFFGVVWGVGGSLVESQYPQFDEAVKKIIDGVFMPGCDSIFDCLPDPETHRLTVWEVPEYKYVPNTPFFNILVPTNDTVRFSYIADRLIDINQPVLFMGETGVGKSVIAADMFAHTKDAKSRTPVVITFSAQTSSNRTQTMIESKLMNRRDHFAAAPNTTVVLFIDDFNMPAHDTFGSQPPLELLRQMLGTGGWYDRSQLQFRFIKGVTTMAACGPPGGGRNKVSERLTAMFTELSIPQPTSKSLNNIFQVILLGYIGSQTFVQGIKELVPSVVRAAVDLYSFTIKELRPTPSKSHYIFNLRDLSKVFQGMMQVTPPSITEEDGFVRLWAHESLRVFADRLTNDEDRLIFTHQIVDLVKHYIRINWVHDEMFVKEKQIIGIALQKEKEREQELEKEKLKKSRRRIPQSEEEQEEKKKKGGFNMWSSLSKIGSDLRPYEEIKDISKLQQSLANSLQDYNLDCVAKKTKEMDLEFFTDAMEHLARITRIIRQPRGNVLLVGVGGCGKQSLTRLASFIESYDCFEIQLAKNYGVPEFREDIRKLFDTAGVDDKPIVFLLSDAQIVQESFLEDINGILSSGEVPSLYDAQQRESIIQRIRQGAKENEKVPEHPDAVMSYMTQRVRKNLHIVLCMSPVGDSFRRRCRMFPSLVNCCTIDWVANWPDTALMSVAMKFLSDAPFLGGDNLMATRIAELCVRIHSSVEQASDRFYKENKRKTYVTPTLFLELIGLMFQLVKERSEALDERISKYESGVNTLAETKQSVADMQEELKKLEPILKQQHEQIKDLMEKIFVDQTKTSEIRATVQAEEAVVNVEAEKAKVLADEAQAELDKIMPVYLEANKALESLSKAAVTEVKTFGNPPEGVKRVMFAVCTLFGRKNDWDTARSMLSQTNFIQTLVYYKVEEIDEIMNKRMRPFIEDPDFKPDKLETVSKAAANICQWIVAIVEFARVSKIIEPKRKAAADAQAKLSDLQAKLAIKQKQLADVEEALLLLKQKFDAKKAECASTEAMIAQTEKRFSNATRLVSALGEEGERWAQSLEEAKQQKNYVLGDSLLSAGYLSYMGPYTTQYRQDLGHVWMEHFKELEIPYSLNFQLEKVLSSPVQIRDWGIQGLPSDQLSVENAVLVTRTRRWPLMIDPQGQANRWIRSKERENKLRVMRPNENHFLRTIINSIRVGQPILLEDVGETLDPQISPLLLQQTVKQGGRTIIRLGNQDIDYNPSFRLFLTTKLANPHYLPDIFIKVNIINFTVTSVGLEDQLLGDVVRNEKAELEEEKDMLVRSMAVDAKLLVDTETKILALLKGTSVQQILDDPSLINTLEQAKNTSSEIMKRVKSSEITDQQLQAARNEYRPMAIRGSVLYFTIVDLAVLDPMYQYSLQYFVSIFSLSLTQTPPYPTLEERLSGLINALTELIYMNVCRGLFETHRLLFSLMITAQISRREGKITNKEWDVFLRGPSHSLAVDSSTALSTSSASLPDSSSTTTSNPTYPKPTVFTVKTGDVNRVNDIPYFTVSPKNPAFPFEGLIDPRCWAELCFMDEKWNLFSGITTVMTTPENVPLWTAFLNKNTPTADKFPDQRFDDLSPFQKLLFIRVISPKSLTKCAMEYVKQSIGETFVQSPPLDLSKAHGDSSKSIPIIFVLSTGADPTQLVVRFAKEKGYSDKLSLLSLGQGQGPIAVKLLEKATMEGNWVFLQNCHLAASWMPELERICLSYLVAETSPKNPNFRLWLSAMPTSSFPIAVLQNGIKLTNEPPKGVRSNVLRSLRTISPDLYENACSYSPFVWRRILFGLAFFHSLIQERRKFGPLGWNIVYEFNDSDFEVSHNHLKMYLNEEAERNAAKEGDDYVFKNSSIPWKALKYLTGTVNYGGRVTDNWDKRTLAAVLAKFYVEEIAEEKPFLLGPAVKGGKEKRDEEVDTNVGGGEEKEGDMPVGEAEVDPETAAAMATEREENRINPYILRNLKTHADAVAFADKFPSTEEPEVFGMHDNAELALQLSEASKMILCMTMMQPRRTAPSGEANTVEKKEKKEEKEEGKKEEITAQGPDREVLIIIQGISAKLPGQLQRSEGKEGVLPQLITRQMMSAVSLQSITEKPAEVLSQPTSLSVVLSQEMVRFNKLLGVITESIAEVERAIAGLVVMSQDIEQVYDSILFGHVPQKWADAAYPSLKPLGGWVIDLVERVNFFRKWLTTGTPKCYWFSGFFFPQGFLTAILQTFARKYKCPIDILNFKYAALKESKEEVKNPPSDGVYVYGLFMEAGRWDMNTMELTEPTPGEMYATMPVLHFLPQQNYSPPQTLYAAPLYKTGARYGVLSTTGHSTNFVTAVTLPTSLPPQHWVLRGTALLCQQNE
jgi:dynein heavy chain